MPPPPSSISHSTSKKSPVVPQGGSNTPRPFSTLQQSSAWLQITKPCSLPCAHLPIIACPNFRLRSSIGHSHLTHLLLDPPTSMIWLPNVGLERLNSSTATLSPILTGIRPKARKTRSSLLPTLSEK